MQPDLDYLYSYWEKVEAREASRIALEVARKLHRILEKIRSNIIQALKNFRANVRHPRHAGCITTTEE